MEWKNDYSINNNEIDEQHKVWIGILNEIEEMIHGKDFNYINLLRILERLDQYVKTHFDYEEELMIKYSYPHIMEHTNSHNVLRDKLRNTYVLELENPKEFYYEMSEYLTTWLTEHIMKVDRLFGNYLKEYKD